jgi:PhoPQ-activated pathogenicity-related protein
MEYKSLYDYLGRAAGSELGKQVATAATQDGVKIKTRQVSNPKYEGEIMLYPSSWLDRYFNHQQEENLPF